MDTYTKANVKSHCEYMRTGHPAVNVKVHTTPTTDDVVKRFKCSEAQAQRACEYCFTSMQQSFWENAESMAQEIFPNCKVYSEGRSGGWLVVHELPDVETWDAVMLAKWRRLEKLVQQEVKNACDENTWFESIEANKWYQEGAEQYNFSDTKDGFVCISEVKRDAIKAGFGLVVRK